jgi:hypothetical protein
VPKDWPDPLPDTIPGEGVVREVELLQMSEDWPNPLPDTIPGVLLPENLRTCFEPSV